MFLVLQLLEKHRFGAKTRNFFFWERLGIFSKKLGSKRLGKKSKKKKFRRCSKPGNKIENGV
jgi:hypothetical protein